MIRWLAIPCAVAALIAAWPAKPQQHDDRRGQRLFLQCQACHSLRPGEPHKIGPNLHAIVGAPAAGRTGYTYSKALKSSGLRWDAATLDRFLAAPTRVVPGTKMIYSGMRSPEDRAALITHLKRTSR